MGGPLRGRGPGRRAASSAVRAAAAPEPAPERREVSLDYKGDLERRAFFPFEEVRRGPTHPP